MHDPRIGRFFAVDPLAPKYPWYTPYQFSGNKVIAYKELEGLEESKAGNVGTYLGLRASGSTHEEAQKVINGMKVAEAQAASHFTVLFAGAAIIATGGLILEVGIGATITYAFEEGVEYVLEEATGIPIILDPIDVLEQITKKGVKKFAQEIIVEGRKFAKGTSVKQMKYWAINVKTYGKELAEKISKGKVNTGKKHNISGEYANSGKKLQHLDKRQKQGYNFETVEDMETYGKEFFEREGANILEYIDKNGIIYRIDTKTQEVGFLQSDGKIQSVFKVIPKSDSKYQDVKEYFLNEIQKAETTN